MIYHILALISIGNLEILNCGSLLRGGFSVKMERFQIRGHVQTTWTTEGEGGYRNDYNCLQGGGGVKALSTWTKTLSILVMFVQLLMRPKCPFLLVLCAF